MTAPDDGHNRAPLELVPLDAPLPRPELRAAVAQSRPMDRAQIREAYLRARFPGVIRSLADLADAERVLDAARCYLRDGRADRASELLRARSVDRVSPSPRTAPGTLQ